MISYSVPEAKEFIFLFAEKDRLFKFIARSIAKPRLEVAKVDSRDLLAFKYLRLISILVGLTLISSCTSYSLICNAPKAEGWIVHSKPTKEMLDGVEIQKSDGSVIWFRNVNGNIRFCDVDKKHSCAKSYTTYNPSNPHEKEVVVSSCPNPY